MDLKTHICNKQRESQLSLTLSQLFEPGVVNLENKLRNEALHRHSHQYALVDVSVADALHADPDDARIIDLLVVDGQSGLRRAAGRRLLR